MAILAKPSRSYKDVEHDAEGLGGINAAPYGGASIKTYRPSYAESHFRRQAMHDPHPTSAFSPLPPAFNIGRKHKEQTLAGQKAELDHILQPGYKSVNGGDDGASSIGGPSRLGAPRTAGGFAARAKGKDVGLGIRPASSLGSFKNSGGGAPNSARSAGVYIDSNGKLHDTEFDPFAGVSALSRRKSRRRGAFGGDRRGGSQSSEGSVSGSDSDAGGGSGGAALGGGDGAPRRSHEASSGHGHGHRDSGYDDAERDEIEIRRRLEAERRRLDEVSGFAAARRRSVISERGGGTSIGGRATPSLRGDDKSTYSLERNGSGSRSKSSQGYYVPSPLSPTFTNGTAVATSVITPTGSSYTTSRTLPTTVELDDPEKHSESTNDERDPEYEDAEEDFEQDRDRRMVAGMERVGFKSPPPPPMTAATTETSPSIPSVVEPHHELEQQQARPRQKVEVAPDGAKRITGFDAPSTPTTPMDLGGGGSAGGVASGAGGAQLRVPDRSKGASVSTSSRTSSDRDREAGGRDRPRPAERPREELFPETPAQAKRREERERRARNGGGAVSTSMVGSGMRSNSSTTQPLAHPRLNSLTVDTGLSTSGRGRILPEIEIVEDDDPRIVFPSNGASTRIQKTHDHVIKGPFSRALNAGAVGAGVGVGGMRSAGGSSSTLPSLNGVGSGVEYIVTGRTGSGRSIPVGSDSKAPSTIIEETGGGYLPSRWANGDRELRMTDEAKDRYRPREWGGKHGDLGGRTEEWRPNTKESIKRNVKDVATNARFSMFRAGRKVLRKAEF